MDAPAVRTDVSLLTADDLFLFNEGTHRRLYDKLGGHLREVDGVPGAVFSVWAPNASSVSVIGDFNGWSPDAAPLAPRGSSGVWEGFVPGARHGDAYKFHIRSAWGFHADKADPYAAYSEVPPATASRLWDLTYTWGDDAWMARRGERNHLRAPIAIYEVHVGSWMRHPGNRPYTYAELAEVLPGYVADLGFTHVEFMPVMEHPYDGSWGYQPTGYFAPSARWGTPQDLMTLVDALHQAGIGVILDWVPSHFAVDEHGLAFFDGTHLYEHADPRKGWHPDWGAFIFNHGRHEVRAFLISSALSWLDRYHVDGIRVDAVASMLYLDYSRGPGEWVPNEYGGNENLEAVDFLRRFNEAVYEEHPDVQTYAEESTAWPGVSRPTYVGGLGFGFKWDMGWMHDTLAYLREDPLWRRYHHTKLTFRGLYAFSENYVLPLSHDEVVHGKGSLIDKMAGDVWQRFANLRLLFAYQFAQPGKKLLFMGGEFAQWREWAHHRELDWELASLPAHAGVRRLVSDLGRLYRERPELHLLDADPAGWEWIEANDWDRSVLAFLRKDDRGRAVLAVFNFTPVPHVAYRVGVPEGGRWKELLNTDAEVYGGSGWGNLGGVEAEELPAHGRDRSVELVLPPLGAVFLAPVGQESADESAQHLIGGSEREDETGPDRRQPEG